MERRALDENERRGKHSIDGILGDRCKQSFWRFKFLVSSEENKDEYIVYMDGFFCFSHFLRSQRWLSDIITAR